jgi:pimeloyl-ACP methyl ester carboxylesterase
MSQIDTHQPGQVFFEGLNGLRIAGSEEGPADGPTVLFLHGGGQTRHSWRRSAAALAREGFHVVRIDARGHGDSDWSPEQDYRPAAMAADTAAVIAKLATPVILVGASMGGLTGLLVAHDLGPSAVTGLVLVDVVPQIESAGGERIRDFMTERPDGFATLDEAAESISRYLPHRPKPASSEGLRRNLRQGPDGRWHWHWDPAFLVDRGDTTLLDLQEDLEVAAIDLQIPILLLRGALSDVVSLDGVHRFLDLVPGTRFIEISGAGHTAAGDDNDAFTDAIHDYLRERSTPGAAR